MDIDKIKKTIKDRKFLIGAKIGISLFLSWASYHFFQALAEALSVIPMMTESLDPTELSKFELYIIFFFILWFTFYMFSFWLRQADNLFSMPDEMAKEMEWIKLYEKYHKDDDMS